VSENGSKEQGANSTEIGMEDMAETSSSVDPFPWLAKDQESLEWRQVYNLTS
jgi:hypothetical protein